MRLWADRQINRQMVAADQATRRIHQERVGAAGLIEIDRREEMPRCLAPGASKHGAVTLTDIFQRKGPDPADRRGSNGAASRRG